MKCSELVIIVKIEIKVEYLHDFPTDEWEQVWAIEKAVEELILSRGFNLASKGAGRGQAHQIFITKGDLLS